MGRVQNTFFFLASALQICTALIAGEAAHRDGLKFGFYIVSAMYFGAACAAWRAVHAPEAALETDNRAAD
jgi:bacteriorhodopsin